LLYTALSAAGRGFQGYAADLLKQYAQTGEMSPFWVLKPFRAYPFRQHIIDYLHSVLVSIKKVVTYIGRIGGVFFCNKVDSRVKALCAFNTCKGIIKMKDGIYRQVPSKKGLQKIATHAFSGTQWESFMEISVAAFVGLVDDEVMTMWIARLECMHLRNSRYHRDRSFVLWQQAMDKTTRLFCKLFSTYKYNDGLEAIRDIVKPPKVAKLHITRLHGKQPNKSTCQSGTYTICKS
jgi:hypothetical protein